MFYKIDSTAATLREYWWECLAPWMWPVFLIAVALKVLRIRLTGSSDDASVESLAPFRIRESSLEDDVRAKFLPLENELADLGFHSPVYHAIDDGLQSQQLRFSTLCHESGNALARIHQRVWTQHKISREFFFPMFVSAFQDGSFLVTSAGKPDVLAPPNVRVIRHIEADAATLWQAHQQALDEERLTKTLHPMETQSDLLAVAESMHAAHRDFHVNRGFFVPMTPDQEEQVTARVDKLVGLQDVDDDHVLEEIESRQNKSRSWTNAALILGVSVLLFVWLGASVWDWKFVLLLLPILFVHELGHYVAMRLFKYRNLRMFFIPLLGAAVTGSHYNVAGWKKVLVSLMGPLPGIALAIPLAVAGVALSQPLLTEAAVLTVIVNGLNLLPVLPLDGGWIIHTLLFSRHYLLDVAFQVVAIAILFLAGSALGERVLFFLGLIMLLGLRWAYKRASIARDLKKSGFVAASDDDQSIPPETAKRIMQQVRQAFPRGLNAKHTAGLTLQVFETLNARPPSWLSTIALSLLYFGSLFTAVLLCVVLVIVQQGGIEAAMAAARAAELQPLADDGIRIWNGESAEDVRESIIAIVGTADDPEAAETLFVEFSAKLPPTASLTLFGHSLIATLPDDDDLREQWLAEFEEDVSDVYVENADYRGQVRLACVAPSDQRAKEIEEHCQEYVFSGGNLFLIPPWSREHEITLAHRKARKTYQALLQNYEIYEDERFAEINQKILRASRTGNTKAVQALNKRMEELTKQLKQNRLDHLQSQVDRYDTELIDHYRLQPVWDYRADEDGDFAQPDADFERRVKEWTLACGVFLGQLPMDGEAPIGASTEDSMQSGYVTASGPLLSFEWLTFARVDRGAPALIEWLRREGCTDFKYSLSSGFDGGALFDGSDLTDE